MNKKILLCLTLTLAVIVPSNAQNESDSTRTEASGQIQQVKTKEKVSWLTMAARDKHASATDLGPGFFWGIKGNVSYNNLIYLASAEDKKAKLGDEFNIEILPTVGYFFNDWSFVGIAASYDYIKANSANALTRIIYELIGKIPPTSNTDTHVIKLQPYWRYRICNLFHPKVGLWLETKAYVGMSLNIRESDNLRTNDFLYGANIHPMISFSATERLYFFTSLDLFAITYDGAALGEGQGDTQFYNNFDLNFNPVRAIGRSFINIGLIKRFY